MNIKSLLTIILLLTFLSADTITYELNTAQGKKTFFVKDVIFDGINNGEVFYTFIVSKSDSNDPAILGKINFSEFSNEIFSSSLSAKCDQLISIEDEEGYLIDFDCSNVDTDSRFKRPNNVATRLGGILILAGAEMLYGELNEECSDCDLEELKSSIDSSRDTQKIAYILIGVGGLLIALGG